MTDWQTKISKYTRIEFLNWLFILLQVQLVIFAKQIHVCHLCYIYTQYTVKKWLYKLDNWAPIEER